MKKVSEKKEEEESGEKLFCVNGHEMKYANAPELKNELYKCDMCRKVFL